MAHPLPSPSRGLWLLAALLAPATAAAQQLDAQRFHPSMDGRAFTLTDDARVGMNGVGGGMTFNYADDPFIYRYNDAERSEVDVLGSVATANAVAFANMSGFRVGVDLPLHLASTGYGVDGFRAIGDLALEGKYSLMDRERDLIGLGFLGRVALPTGNGDTWLGEKHPTAQLTAAAAYGDRVVYAANLGMRVPMGSADVVDDVTWGSRVLWGAGVSVPILDPLWAAAELSGEHMFGSKGASGATPFEGLVSLRGNPTGDLIASLGFGAGITRGIGAPDYRIVAGVGWVPGQQSATDAYVGGPSAGDRDGDGILDSVDLCPDQPEDRNGKFDTDGCPDAGLTPTALRVISPDGSRVAGATIELVNGPETGQWTSPDGEVTRSLIPGRYAVAIRADHYVSSTDTLVIPDTERHEASFRLQPEVAMSAFTLTVTDVDGVPVEANARILGLDAPIVTGQDGIGHTDIPSGAYEMVVSAPGYGVSRRTIKAEPGGTASVDVVLTQSRVQLTDQRIVILDKVFFEFDSAVIKPESFTLLDEVTQVVMDHPELEIVEIQGHTDDQGAGDYNRSLSQRRAEAVMMYMVRAGVAGGRLVAQGFGEDQPLQPGASDEARAANRRVEFHIQRRADTGGTDR